MALKSFVLLVIGMAIFFACSTSSADVPHMINYQGQLTTLQGALVNDTVQITFSIYPDTLGSLADWSETQAQVMVNEGIFNVLLGSVNSIPASLFGGSVKYLGVQVESDAEMRPLKPIVSVAYAFRSLEADTADYAHAFSGTVENADKVDGLHASSTPTGGYLYPLDGLAKIPNDRLYTGAGNGLDADLLDGQHASDFLSTANDYGRSGVATDLYEGTSTLTSKYVNEGQASSVTSGMITDNQIVDADISGSANISPSKVSGTAWTATNDGSGSGLDADLFDGFNSSDFVLSTNLSLINQVIRGTIELGGESSGYANFSPAVTPSRCVVYLRAIATYGSAYGVQVPAVIVQSLSSSRITVEKNSGTVSIKVEYQIVEYN